MRIFLHDGWTVRAVGGEIPAHVAGVAVPATVPGCVHLDLMAAGLIPDPYLDGNEALVAWIGRVDWRYETTFRWAAGDSRDEIDLVALGLDTHVTVSLNGTVLGRAANMHRTHRFAVAGLLGEGDNTLALDFAAPLTAAERASADLGPRPHVNTHPFNAVRRMASGFGWDWGPDLATVGIWRPLQLETWSPARIASVRPLVDVRDTVGVLDTHIEIARGAGRDEELTVEVSVAGQRVRGRIGPGACATVVTVEVLDVQRWWPRGYGPQPLYTVDVTLADCREELGRWRGEIGFRTVRLDTTPDDAGTPFTIVVNDVRVFARGVNWIPDDAFPSRVDRYRYQQRISQAAEANVNLIRVWGGGIYESEDFYELCDRQGLLVWQDFLFACAAYAEEPPLRDEVIAEAREAVTRLSRHPSLVLWNGGNESIWGFEDWDWQDDLAGRTWGLGYYTDVLPGIVAELDPTRPYSPGSPYSFRPGVHPNDPAHGTLHIWDVWNQVDYTGYRDYRPRFVAEFGYQAPPTWATLVRAVHDEPRRADSPSMLAHQKAEDGNGKLIRGLAGHLPEPDTFDDWHWATSLNQARAVVLGIEHFRSLAPLCMGTVMWQLNDMWPVTSWAAVDGDGRRKPLWYALRRSYADRLLTFQPRDGALALVAVNDSDTPWRDEVRVTRRSTDNKVHATHPVSIDVGPRATVTLALPGSITEPGDPAGEALFIRGTGRQWASWFFADDVHGSLPQPKLDVEARAVYGGYRLTVTARALIRDLAILADRIAPDAQVDDMLVTLLPDETASFFVRTAAVVPESTFTDPLIMRSANQLLHPAVPTTRPRRP